MVPWSALSTHSKKVLDSNLGQDVSERSLHVLPVSPGFLQHSKNMQTGGRLIIHSKLPVGVNVSVDGHLYLYISYSMNWRHVQDDPAFAQRC